MVSIFTKLPGLRRAWTPAGGIKIRAFDPPSVMCHSATSTAPHSSPLCWPDSFRPVMRSKHSRSHTLSCREFGPRKRAVGMFSQTAFGTLAGVRSSSSTAEISHKAESMAGVSGVVARRVRAAEDTAICSISGHYYFHLSIVNLSIVPSGVSTHTLRRVHSYPPACPLIPSGVSTFTLRRVHF